MHQKLETALKDLVEPYLAAQSFSELAGIVLLYIERDYPNGVGFFGGGPYVVELLEEPNSFRILGDDTVTRKAVQKLRLEHKPVIDWGIFIPKSYELWRLWRNQDKKSHPHEYCEPMLDDFYGRIAMSPLVNVGYFMNGWETFRGPARLHQIFEGSGKMIEVLPRNYHLVAPPLE